MHEEHRNILQEKQLNFPLCPPGSTLPFSPLPIESPHGTQHMRREEKRRFSSVTQTSSHSSLHSTMNAL
ncbi:hypothetical protein RJT34_14308 [Clitoria ternatea]|uniref:Uncharacterized protein n=1 Tax=Clitoria ternatea TaxID=43366 RepID=A0AAN9JQH3_CLITE